jgi:hypothetical protein
MGEVKDAGEASGATAPAPWGEKIKIFKNLR